MNHPQDPALQSGFVVTVQFEVDVAQLGPFMQEMVTNARASREREPGCLVFDVCVDPAQPTQVFLYELYTDAAAFEQHKREAHFLSFDRAVTPWLLGKVVRSYTLVDR